MKEAQAIEDLAAKTPGKKSLAMMAFARALRALPATICDNAGLDSAEIVANLRAAHSADPNSRMGIDVVLGEAGDMSELGIYEAFRWGRGVGHGLASLAGLQACASVAPGTS